MAETSCDRKFEAITRCIIDGIVIIYALNETGCLNTGFMV
jgi:hypothetical protein